MRLNLILALAPYIGSTLTTEKARAIVDSLKKDAADLKAPPAVWRGFTFQRERLADGFGLIAQRVAYLTERWPERICRPNWRRLEAMDKDGSLIIFTARQDHVLAASLWLFRGQSLDSSQDAVTDDLWYVAPEYRSTGVGMRLWKYSEETMFDDGVREAIFSMRHDNKALRAAQFMGYTPVATQVMKTVQGDDFNLAPTRHTRRIIHEPIGQAGAA